jgi:hypothetical protein
MFGPSRRTLYRELLRRTEHYERIIESLNDRLAAAYGRPWNVPPADLTSPDPEPQARKWVWSPEQEPVT